MDRVTSKRAGGYDQTIRSNLGIKTPENVHHNRRNVKDIASQTTKTESREQSEIVGSSLLKRIVKTNNPDDPISINSDSSGTSLIALEAMAVSVLAVDKHVDFHIASFLSGHGKTQQQQVEALSKNITEKFYSGCRKNLSDLLDQIKHKDSQMTPLSVSHSFLLRCAILQASEENGCGIQSWEAFTHAKPSEVTDNAFWPWLEKPSSWIPEAQGAAAKYIEHSWIQALELSKAHPDQQVIAYKGSYGAGKTSHGKALLGEFFSGVIAPDSAKKVIRKALSTSHSTIHIQGSAMAFKLFDGLIKQKIGTIVYDSSLSSANDVKALIVKSEAVAKPLRVIDITRDDKARVLALLARSIEDEAPRIPLEVIEYGAEIDRKQRPDCMNAILESSGIPGKDSKTGQEKMVSHTYEFHCGNAEGSDRQLVFTLKSGQPPIWNDQLEPAAVNARLASQGVSYNTKTGRFQSLFPQEQWRDELRVLLKQPVKALVKGLSNEEAQIREKSFKERLLPLTKTPAFLTPSNLYLCLAPDIRSTLSAKAFIKSFDTLDLDGQKDIIEKFQQLHNSGTNLTYLELPVVMAIELHKAFRSTPKCWI